MSRETQKLSQWQPIIVRWIDAYTHYEPTNSKEFIKEYKKCLRRSIGYLIHRDKERIVLCMEDDRSDLQDVNDSQTMTTIPASLILEVIELRPASRTKRARRS